LTTSIALVGAPGAVHRVLVIPQGTSQIVVARLEPRELNVHFRIFRSRLANPEEHLTGRIVLSSRREGFCQGEPISPVVAIDCRGATQSRDGCLGPAAGKVMLTGDVPGAGVAQPNAAIRTSRGTRQDEADDDGRAEKNDDHDFPMDEPAIRCLVTRLALPANEWTSAADA
jgi:hypothetical protein